MTDYDAILVPGGGLTERGEPTVWSRARLDRALDYSAPSKLVLLSGGTPHRPPPFDATGQPIPESLGGARYLLSQGVDPKRILLETASRDTVGNAVFARLLHVEPRGWRRLLVITSEHHLPRTRAIFEVVFALPRHHAASPTWTIDFESVPDVGLSPREWEARRLREQRSREQWLERASRFRSLEDLHEWLFTEHACYSADGTPTRAAGDEVAAY